MPNFTCSTHKIIGCDVLAAVLMIYSGMCYIGAISDSAYYIGDSDISATSVAIAFWGGMLVLIATTCMKLAATGPRLYYVGVVLGYVICFTLFPIALRSIPLSIAYTVWSGAGTAASVAIGALLFAEKLTLAKLFWIGVIVTGVIGLNL